MRIRKFLVVALALVFSACSVSERPKVPEGVNRLYQYTVTDSIYLQGLEELIASDKQQDEAWGWYLKARDLIVQGISVQALPMLERSEILFRSLNDDYGLSRVLLLKAHGYWVLGSGEEILATSEETMALRQGDTMSWATAAGNYSTYLIDFGYYEKALEYSDTVLSIFKKRRAVNPSEAYAVRAEALHRLGKDSAQVDSLIQGALSLVTQAVPDIDKQNIYLRALGLNAMSQEQLATCILFARSHEFWALEAKARAQFVAYELIGESKDEAIAAEILANKNALQQVDEGQSKFLAFELERGKRERLRFEETAKLRQQTLVLFIGLALMLSLVIWSFYRNALKTREATMGMQEAELELESYKNKIRPHFLFNQLNNVSGILNQERVLDAQEYLAELGQYLRSLLGEQNAHFSTIEAEIKHLQSFVNLQQQSSYGHVAYSNSVEGVTSKALMPTGLLQPLVENSFKYAGHGHADQPWIKITFKGIASGVLLEIQDSGFGDLPPVGGTGNGLALVEQRIKFHQKRSKTPINWAFETNFTKEKGTVSITMPLMT